LALVLAVSFTLLASLLTAFYCFFPFYFMSSLTVLALAFEFLLASFPATSVFSTFF